MSTPLIITLTINNEAQVFFDEQRKKYFPPAINYLSAHLTLFHHLPDNEPLIADVMEATCNHHNKIEMAVTKPVFIGKGVAYKIESKSLVSLHKTLQKQWLPFLLPQDRQGLWPHITVQNKEDPQTARQLLSELQNNFVPFTAYGVGFTVFRYLNGRWQLYRQFVFAG